MNSLLKAVAAAALGCLIVLGCGCASSDLVNIWHDASFQAPPLSKMLVVAIRKNEAKRRIWEDAFVGELTKHGVAATPSYRLFPATTPDTNQIKATVQTNGFDGMLVVLRLPTEINSQYVQGYTTLEPSGSYSPSYDSDRHRHRNYRSYYNTYYSPYWQRYSTYYREISHPGYIETQAVAMSAIDVTAFGNGDRLIWSATSRTPDPGSVTDIQEGIVGLVISELAHLRIIGSKK